MVGFEVKGARRLNLSMQTAARALDDLRPVNKKVAQTIAPAASANAPRRSGTLAGSIRGTGTKKEARVRSALVYGNPIHWGWAGHNIAPHPFIVETIDTRKTEVANTYENAVADEIGRIKGA